MNTPELLPPSVGTDLKLAVTATLGQDVHLSGVDFSCAFFRRGGTERLLLTKQQMTYVDDDTYMAVVDTTAVGPGDYLMRLTALIPDPDCPDAIRREVVTVDTGIHVDP